MFEEIKYRLKRKLFRHMEAYDITLNELMEKQMNGAEIIDVRNEREYSVPNKNKEIVVYCSSGFRGTSAYKKLRCLGYRNVWNLYGGLENY